MEKEAAMEGLRIPWAEAEQDALADAARMFPHFTAAQIEYFAHALPRPLHGTDLIRELVRQQALQLQQAQQRAERAQQRAERAERRADLSLYTSLSRRSLADYYDSYAVRCVSLEDFLARVQVHVSSIPTIESFKSRIPPVTEPLLRAPVSEEDMQNQLRPTFVEKLRENRARGQVMDTHAIPIAGDVVKPDFVLVSEEYIREFHGATPRTVAWAGVSVVVELKFAERVASDHIGQLLSYMVKMVPEHALGILVTPERACVVYWRKFSSTAVISFDIELNEAKYRGHDGTHRNGWALVVAFLSLSREEVGHAGTRAETVARSLRRAGETVSPEPLGFTSRLALDGDPRREFSHVFLVRRGAAGDRVRKLFRSAGARDCERDALGRLHDAAAGDVPEAVAESIPTAIAGSDASIPDRGGFLHVLDMSPAGVTDLQRCAHASNDAASVRRLHGYLSHVFHALVFAHARRVVHLDVKPSNIVVRADGRAMLIDWENACLPGSLNSGGSLRTPAFCCLAQQSRMDDFGGWGGAAAGPVQPEWDFESFAFTAIYLLCGKRLPWIPDAPFTGALQIPSSSETFGLKRDLLAGAAAPDISFWEADARAVARGLVDGLMLQLRQYGSGAVSLQHALSQCFPLQDPSPLPVHFGQVGVDPRLPFLDPTRVQ